MYRQPMFSISLGYLRKKAVKLVMLCFLSKDFCGCKLYQTWRLVSELIRICLKKEENLHIFIDTVSLLGREEGYTVKYTPLPEGGQNSRELLKAKGHI